VNDGGTFPEESDYSYHPSYLGKSSIDEEGAIYNINSGRSYPKKDNIKGGSSYVLESPA
jgi:hypothetical protein